MFIMSVVDMFKDTMHCVCVCVWSKTGIGIKRQKFLTSLKYLYERARERSFIVCKKDQEVGSGIKFNYIYS